MTIKFTNILNPQLVIDMQDSKTTPLHLSAVKQKTMDFLQCIESNTLTLAFMGKKSTTMIMRQDFRDNRTCCALIEENGRVRQFDAQGNVIGTSVSRENPKILNETVQTTWDALLAADTADNTKLGLVLSSELYEAFARNKDAGISDKTFMPVLQAIKNIVAPENVPG